MSWRDCCPALEVTVQVLITYTSASPWKGTSSQPRSVKAEAKLADSNWLTLQPSVAMAIFFMGGLPRLPASAG